MTETATAVCVDAPLFEYVLRLGDSCLILGHRLSEWCGHGPQLEEDIALANVALDLIGQARMLLSYGGEVEGAGRSEDDLAYLRDGTAYRNWLLVERPNGDYAYTTARQFLFDAFMHEFWRGLSESRDQHLADVAAKAMKENAYHLRHSSQWMIRFGDGTEESHDRVQNALNDLWAYTGELFESDEVDAQMCADGIGVGPELLKTGWDRTVDAVLGEATLKRPEDGWMHTGGKQGRHSEHLGLLLAEMQYLQRAYPGAEW